jgi:hypothetical protein
MTNVTSLATATAFEEILAAVASSTHITLPETPQPGADVAVDAVHLAGRYQTRLIEVVVGAQADGLHVTVIHKGADGAARLPDDRFRLQPIDARRFIATDVKTGGKTYVAFTHLDDGGVPHFLFWGGRLAERIAR